MSAELKDEMSLRAAEFALIGLMAVVEGVVFGTMFGGMFVGGALAPGALIAVVAILTSACVAVAIVVLASIRGRDGRLAAALMFGAASALAIAYVIQPVGGPV